MHKEASYACKYSMLVSYMSLAALESTSKKARLRHVIHHNDYKNN